MNHRRKSVIKETLHQMWKPLCVFNLLGAAKVEAAEDLQHVWQDKDANVGNYDTTGMSGSASGMKTSI